MKKMFKNLKDLLKGWFKKLDNEEPKQKKGKKK